MKVRNILYADGGKVLTNGTIYGRIVYLAEGESPENWREIAEAEATAIFADSDGGEFG